MTFRINTTVASVIAAACSTLLLVIVSGSNLPRIVSAVIDDKKPDPVPSREVIEELADDNRLQFYNWQNDVDHRYNFGPDAYPDIGKYPEVYGELLDRLTDDGENDEKLPDVALMAAVAYGMDDRLGTDILAADKENSKNTTELVNNTVKHLMDDPKYREEVLGKIKAVLEESDVSVEEIGDYTSTMWMVPDGFDGRPSITVEDSYHNGGHALVIKKDGKVLKLRLECGYQPLEISWPNEQPPKTTEPPKTTTPPPNETTPPAKTTPPNETTPPAKTTPPNETTPPPTTTLAPKNTQEAVPVQTDPDNGGSKGGDAIKNPTPEPTWPVQTKQTPQATQAPIEAPTVTYKDNTYVVDEAGDWTPQKDVVSDTPTDAAVAPDDVVIGTAPAGGGDFANRYGW
jgi:hypothetical protein